MILPFSTQINGKPTYFVERIWEGLLRKIYQTDKEYIDFLSQHKNRFGEYWDWFPEEYSRMENPKIHTIREDKNDRWQEGIKIDFFINCRQKNMFRFAPVLQVVSIQKIEIDYSGSKKYRPWVWVDGISKNINEIEKLAQNDGFDTIEDFFNYFNQDFKGKIIHWTDFRYS